MSSGVGPLSIIISTLGGVGLFLLGMSVMTQGLKSLAGPALRTLLSTAAATPLRGAFWGAMITLLVQSSSATTMTTIGLVSAGLLTFPEGLGLVFGANVGTTGTAWLVALIGVRVSLTTAALPIIFVGALTRLVGRGRVSASGGALAGFGLLLFGLTILQQGMSGLAEQIHPADLPTILSGDAPWWVSLLGVLTLIAVGLVMTALMQSSTAAVAVTLSAYYAGALGLDQACALIIGQNIGTATSSAMAAIGASTTAKRLAIAYVLFKVVASTIAVTMFPFTTRLIVHASQTIDGVTLLAAYHTAFNVVGVLVLLPLIKRFTRLVERILPERGSPLTRSLDPSALGTPIVAIEAVRQTIARSLALACKSIQRNLDVNRTSSAAGKDRALSSAGAALHRAQVFLSDMNGGPPANSDEQRRLASTLHALDHAARLTETASGEMDLATLREHVQDTDAQTLCATAMQSAIAVTDEIIAPHDAASGAAATLFSPTAHAAASAASTASIEAALRQLEQCAAALAELRQSHRIATLNAAASGKLPAQVAISRVDTLRDVEMLAYHAWRCARHLAVDAGG